MSLLKEVTERTKSEKLAEDRALSLKRQVEATLDELQKRETEDSIAQAYSECDLMLKEGNVAEILEEAKKEFFKGHVEVLPKKSQTGVYERQPGSNFFHTVAIDFSSRITLKGRVSGTMTLLKVDAIVQKPTNVASFHNLSAPILRISCHTEEPAGILRSLFPHGSKWDNGSYQSLGISEVEGREEPIKEWQDPIQVRKAIAQVLVAKNLV